MKKRTIIIRCLVLLTLITLAACASTRTHESSGEYVDDSVITTKVKTLLANDAFFKSFQISVETYKGIVQLSGFVNSQQAVDKAGQIARRVLLRCKSTGAPTVAAVSPPRHRCWMRHVTFASRRYSQWAYCY
jgi:hyperosmotically inducible protein